MRILEYGDNDGEAALREVSDSFPKAASPPSSTPVFLVVTPVFNGAKYLDEAIESVVGQAGDFFIRYHVQDGGSADGTIDIVRRWYARLAIGDFPIRCAGVQFTFTSRPDDGMYDAIASGFRSLEPSSEDVMCWINADDRLAPGAMRDVAEIFSDIPHVELAGGRVELIDSLGRTTVSGPLMTYPRQTVAAGLHDGRFLPFIQQEGTFWRGALWLRVGGVDARFRLAGDWDLWRRFAAEVEYYAIDAVTGIHRRHSGQLTAEMAAYYQEIDVKTKPILGAVCAAEREYLEWWRPSRAPDERFTAHTLHRSLSRAWLARAPKALPGPGRHRLLPHDGSWAVISGVDNPEGPFPALGIDTMSYWTVSKRAVLEIFSSQAGRRTVSLVVRGMLRGQVVGVSLAGARLLSHSLRGGFPRAETLLIEYVFDVGPCRIEIEVDRLLETPEGRSLGVLLSDVKFGNASLRWRWLPRAFRNRLNWRAMLRGGK